MILGLTHDEIRTICRKLVDYMLEHPEPPNEPYYKATDVPVICPACHDIWWDDPKSYHVCDCD